MHRPHNIRNILLLGTALFVAPVSAFAKAADPAPGAPDAPSGEVTALSDVVVTATKRETNLPDTPIAISVMSSEALEDGNS